MEFDPSGLSRSEAARARARREEGAHYQELTEREAAEAERTWQQSGMGIVDYVRSRAEEGSPEFDLDWETMREIARDREAGRFSAGGDSAKNGAARDGKMAVAKLTKTDYKQKRPQGTNELSLPRRKDPGRARGMNTVRAVSAVRLSLEAPNIIANVPTDVKSVYDGLVDVVKSIEDGRKVLGLPNAVTESNFINAIFKAGIDQHTQTVNGVKVLSSRKAGNSSGYRIADGRTARVSTHPAEAKYFIQNKTDNNVSFVIQRPEIRKEFSPDDKANVLEIVFNRNSLRNNPEDMARIVHDIARFVATGEYNDTLGAAKYNYSGSKEFIADTMRSLIGDAEMREDAKTAKKIRKEAKRRGIELVGNLGKMAVGGRIAAESLGKTKEYDRAERMLKAKNANPLFVWKQTGFWKGADGKLRFEIPDGKLKPIEEIERKIEENRYAGVKLGDIIEANELFDAYPYLNEVPVHFHGERMGRDGAAYSPSDDAIYVYRSGVRKSDYQKHVDRIARRIEKDNKRLTDLSEFANYVSTLDILGIKHGTEPELRKEIENNISELEKQLENAKTVDARSFRSNLMHEIQHALQERENFARGAGLETARKWAEETLGEKAKTMSDYKLYAAFAGEVEARNVQKRLGMTDAERGEKAPWETEDVRANDQVVRFAESASTNQEVSLSFDEKEVSGSSESAMQNKSAPDFYESTGRVPKKVGRSTPPRLLELKESISQNGQMRPEAFLLAVEKAFGFDATNVDKSTYAQHNGLRLRFGNHRANALFFLTQKEYDDNTSIVVKMAERRFRTNKDVSIREYVYYPDKMTPETQSGIIDGLLNWLKVGDYNDEHFDELNVSPREKQDLTVANGKMSVGRTGGGIDPSVFVFDPSAKIVAMGETEQNAGGLAAGIEKKEALRPWTKKMSPADLAKPIAFDAADMVMFWRAVSGSVRNPHVQKGERIAGRKPSP